MPTHKDDADYLRASVAHLRIHPVNEIAEHVNRMDSIAKKLELLPDEHDHSSHTCKTCISLYNTGFNRGYDAAQAFAIVSVPATAKPDSAAPRLDNASLVSNIFSEPQFKPFDVDSLASLLANHMDDLTAQRRASEIANHFAAPERKLLACTMNQASEIITEIASSYAEHEDDESGYEVKLLQLDYNKLASAINKVLALQPESVESDTCADCGGEKASPQQLPGEPSPYLCDREFHVFHRKAGSQERCGICDHADKCENFRPFMCLHEECTCNSDFHRKADVK